MGLLTIVTNKSLLPSFANVNMTRLIHQKFEAVSFLAQGSRHSSAEVIEQVEKSMRSDWVADKCYY